jgi:hypothetical protein
MLTDVLAGRTVGVGAGRPWDGGEGLDVLAQALFE